MNNSYTCDTTTRPSLLLRLRNQDDNTAWQDFVEVYGAMINEYCTRRGVQPADSAEIAQEVLLQVSRSIGSFEYQPNRGRFRGWLATIVRTKMIEFFRKKTRYQTLLASVQAVGSEDSGQDGVWVDVWQTQLVAAALRIVGRRMSESTYAAFYSVWVQDEAAAKVAARHSEDVTWVYVAKSRGLKLLRQSVLELADEIPGASLEHLSAIKSS